MRLSSVVNSAILLGSVCPALVFGQSSQETFSAPSDVLDLTPESFESSVADQNLVLVEFFAPWCGHCKALAPEYEKAATVLAQKGIKLAKVDCVEHGDLCGQHGVTGYPTLKVFRNGTPTDYSGPRKADGIVSYMTKQSLPAVSDVTEANHDEFKQADKVVVIAYVATKIDAPASVFSAVADEHRDQFMFGLSTDEAVAKAAGVTPPAIVLYKKFDEGRVDFPSTGIKDTSHPVLQKFVTSEAMPLLDEVSGENYPTYAQSGLPLAYIFLDPTAEGKEAILDSVRPVAKEHRGEINFVWIDALKFGDHAKSLNVPTDSWPRFVITDMKEGLKYPLDATPSFAVIDAHVKSFVAGTLEPSLKSEPIPEKNDAPVTVVVGQEYSKYVLEDSKDVMIEFYAPWCGHCKRLAPIYDELGEYFSDFKDKVTIAKMDATENDLPSSAPFKVAGFPTIKFKPAGSSEFLNYEGDRTLDSMIAFINENAKNHLSLPPKKTADVTEEEPQAEGHDEL